MGFAAVSFAFITIVALVVGQVFGARLRRSAIGKRLDAGPLVVVDRASVTLIGTIRAVGDELIEAPLSGRRGVVVYAHAELPEVDARLALPENVILMTRRMIPFELDTPSGIALVDGTEADLDFVPARVPGRSAERERDFVVGHGRSATVAPARVPSAVTATPLRRGRGWWRTRATRSRSASPAPRSRNEQSLRREAWSSVIEPVDPGQGLRD